MELRDADVGVVLPLLLSLLHIPSSVKERPPVSKFPSLVAITAWLGLQIAVLNHKQERTGVRNTSLRIVDWNPD